MRSLKNRLLSILGLLFFATIAFGYINPKEQGAAHPNNNNINFREDCTTAKAQVDQDVNNVRARLTTGGDVWWDRQDGRYVVPKVEPGEIEVSSIFAGGVWLGGLDPGGNLKVAAQTYGNSSGQSDFWPGPLDPVDGTTDKVICDKWDRFFEVSGEEIQEHLRNVDKARDGEPYLPEMIPQGVKGWPAKGNEFFFDVHEFELPNTPQALACFFDVNGNGLYEPLDGDFPTIEIRGCEEKPPQFPDEMIFWIYNDAGGIHGESNGIPIRMEVQVQSFAFATNDEINDMTFQRYKLINRALEDIDSTFFAMWVDADLGCFLDDFVGSDTSRSLAYVYNADAEDGQPGTTCQGGVATYGTEIPIIGIDYFRGPLDQFRNEIGMTSFTYFNNGGFNNPPPGTTDPNTAQEFFNYLSGTWRDGVPFSFGGDAYDPTNSNLIDFAFTDPPDDQSGWSMCTQDLPEYDRRTIQASGPFVLQPGAINELIIGAVWVPDLDYPCPDITRVLFADDLAQALFDNCFDITDGPDAPDVDWIELDEELIAVFTNDTVISNNAFEEYAEVDLQAPQGVSDNLYHFEGYKLFQLAGPEVTVGDLDNPDKARQIFQVDIRNGVGEIFNWRPIPDPGSPEVIWIPQKEVDGADQGVRHTFRITRDQFASGDNRLINHKKYYFTVLAYAYNNYKQFDPLQGVGQRKPYLEGRRNIRTYVPIPRPIVDRKVNAKFGDGAVITRIDGAGVGGNFLDISDESEAAILDGSFTGEITYKPGKGPIKIVIYNSLEVKDGEFELTFVDEDLTNDKLDNEVRWKLTNLSDNSSPVLSDKTIDDLNEQILAQFGFSIAIAQTQDVGELGERENGVIGYEEEYAFEDKPIWFSGIPDDSPVGQIFGVNLFNYVVNASGEVDEILDKDQAFNHIGPGFFVPYQIVDYRPKPAIQGINPPYITPAWRKNGGIVRDNDKLQELNNVDIVFTSNKDLWSRCVVVETKSPDYDGLVAPGGGFLTTEEDRKQFDLRGGLSVSKNDNDGDGLPDPGFEDGEFERGMGWFPGYAIDVETGKRLNVFFGENSIYREENGFLLEYNDGKPNGADMMFNPTSQILMGNVGGGATTIRNFFAGGQHFIYVTNREYDKGAELAARFDPNQNSLKKIRGLKWITWTGFPIMLTGERMLSYADGLIPNDLTIKLRVENPYSVAQGTGEFNGYPTYRFTLKGLQAEELDQVHVESALDKILMVPNPYFAFSEYETSQFSTTVKITNLPAKCTVTIYSLDGKFIRQYDRDEVGIVPQGNNRAIASAQIVPDIEWDLKNNKGIPIAAGVYLIHVDAPGLGERTLKWFGINRQFDPSGL